MKIRNLEFKTLEYLFKIKDENQLRYLGLKIKIEWAGLPDFRHYKYQSLVNKCFGLKKLGLIQKNKFGSYFITEKGTRYFLKLKNEKEQSLKDFTFSAKKKSSKNLLIFYDIPQEKKKLRDWFRQNLVCLDFEMVQKSVWVGPGPLPKEFVKYLEEIKAVEYIKSFKLKGDYRSKE